MPTMDTHPSAPRILFIDAYDSFSQNIVSLLVTELNADVRHLYIDSPLLDASLPSFHDRLHNELLHYDAIVCGPGPGSPNHALDIGLMKHLWDLSVDALIPILGICLGFQSLVHSCGGSVRQLHQGLHGMIRTIVPRPYDADIFADIKPFKATLYHSLGVDIGQNSISSAEWSAGNWDVSSKCPEIVPLAWVEEQRANLDEPERILMAVKHRRKPFWGLQYHPESICTEASGHQVLRNWYLAASRWNKEHERVILSDGPLLATRATNQSLVPQQQAHNKTSSVWTRFGLDCEYWSQVLPLPRHVQAPDIMDVLQREESERIILESTSSSQGQNSTNVKGRYTVIALDVQEALRLEYRAGNTYATAKLPRLVDLPVRIEERIPLEEFGGIWQLIAYFHEQRKSDPNEHLGIDSPFLGGFMGYITYEQGLNGIGVAMPGRPDHGDRRPDVCLAWITKSIVIDHTKGLIHIQHLCPSDSQGIRWAQETAMMLKKTSLWQISPPTTPKIPRAHTAASVQKPSASSYEAKVRLCQEHISAGDTYELCLTDQTTITRASIDPLSDSWTLYNILRQRQPAPFASYLRLGTATLVSASPERFLSYSSSGLCSMRPMKGTVRKTPEVDTLAKAETLLHIPKEEAENLMIVDLVRHDLHSVCGAGNVTVPELLKVEEYESVFQMITVVEGQVPLSEGFTGLDVLAASLPPGSMTGAPKKRSCEILRGIEDEKDRGLYAGVVGFMDVSGRGDWSVTIRSAFRWDDELTQNGFPQDIWHVGAGGAVTILSTAQGETEEMLTKLSGPLSMFEV